MADETILLGVIELTEANRLKDLLGEKGVTLDLAYHPDSCGTGGCRPAVEVWVKKEDMSVLEEVMSEEQKKLFSDLTFDPQLVGQVFDPTQEQAICPACGTPFSTSLRECPECGLVFALPEA